MAFTKVTGPGIHTLSNIISHNIDSSGIITATKFVGTVEGPITGDLITNDWITHEGDPNTRIGFPDNDKVEIQTGGLTAIHVNSTQKVGIGSTSLPTSNLEIHGGEDNPSILLKRNTGGGDVASIAWGAENASPQKVAMINYRGGGAPGGMQFYTGGGTSSERRMIINPSGLVAIGTDNPTDTLHIGKKNSNHGIKLERYGATNPGSSTIQVQSNGALNITSSGNITLLPTSRVGIGTNDPDNLLHLAGTNTTVWPFTSAVADTYAYTPYPHELQIQNHARGVEGSFAGIYFHAGAHTDGSKMATARIAAVETGDYKADLVFANRGHNADDHKEHLRITGNGDIVTQGLSSYSFNNDNNNTKVFEVTGDGTVGEYGVINISGIQTTDSGTIGVIKFINRDNSNASSGSNAGSKQIGSIEMRAYTGDANAGDDSGGYFRFITKTEAGGNGERMRITGIGSVGINNTDPIAMLDVGGAYNKHGLRVTSGASGYQDPLIVRRSTGGDTFRVSGNGAVVSESSMFTHYNHLVCQGGSGGNAVKNYILVCKTNTNDARLSGHFVITRQAGASGIAISKIEANLISNNSAADWRYQTRSMSTRGNYPGLEGRWVTLTYGGNNYYAIRLDPATDSSRWPSQPQHCYFTGTENNCVGNGLGTIIDDNANTISSITELDDIQGTTVVRNSYNYIKEGYLQVQGGDGQGAMVVQPYEMNVNNGAQPTTLTVKAQKAVALDLNRMYSHGTILQFRHNNDAVGYFSVNGTSSSHTSSGSDIRLKKDFEDWTEEVLPHFKSLKPQKFRFNSEDETAEKTKGYMAQDNLDKFPEAYPLNPDDDRYWFAPSNMVPYLMKALQEEIIKREEIEAKYNALEARIAALES